MQSYWLQWNWLLELLATEELQYYRLLICLILCVCARRVANEAWHGSSEMHIYWQFYMHSCVAGRCIRSSSS